MIYQGNAFGKLIYHKEIKRDDLDRMPSSDSDNMGIYDVFIQILLDSTNLHELETVEKVSNDRYKMLEKLIYIARELVITN